MSQRHLFLGPQPQHLPRTLLLTSPPSVAADPNASAGSVLVADRKSKVRPEVCIYTGGYLETFWVRFWPAARAELFLAISLLHWPVLLTPSSGWKSFPACRLSLRMSLGSVRREGCCAAMGRARELVHGGHAVIKVLQKLLCQLGSECEFDGLTLHEQLPSFCDT